MNEKRKHSAHFSPSFTVGWYEWCALPLLKIPAIKAKMDTGAKTSAIHAYQIEPFSRKREKWIRFQLHPIQANDKIIVPCEALVVDQRYIMSSNGHKEHRYVIKTALTIANASWEIELTLSNRDPMRFRLLLGREALKGRALVDPARKLTILKYSHGYQLDLYKKKS